jgi:hypothetical protein
MDRADDAVLCNWKGVEFVAFTNGMTHLNDEVKSQVLIGTKKIKPVVEENRKTSFHT